MSLSLLIFLLLLATIVTTIALNLPDLDAILAPLDMKPELKPIDAEKVSLVRVMHSAKQLFNGEVKKFNKESIIGGKFGLFSASRHTPEEYKIFSKKLNKSKDALEAIQSVKDALAQYGSHWSTLLSYNHSFNNYFLTCLRHENITLYKKIIGEAYGITFISGSILLQRRDKRKKDIIFNEGFQLKLNKNKSTTRKKYYVDVITDSYGISFSKKIPPIGCYGSDEFYYSISLPHDHDFLLVDIVKSPRNRDNLDERVRNLEEVNSLDNIPYTAVKSIIWQTTPPRVEENKGFSNNAKLKDSPVIHQGICY